MDLLSISQRLLEAVAWHRAGRLQEAEQAYREVLRGDPAHLDANRLLGILTTQTGRDHEAVQLFQKVLAARSDPDVHVNLGQALKRLGRLEEAVDSYRQALCLEPNHPAVHYNLGNALRDLDRFDEAAGSYQRALSMEPGFVQAHCNLGSVLKSAGALEEAMESYHRALAIEPDLAECHYNVGLALNDLGRLDEAIAAYGRALAINPDHPDAHFGLSLTLLLGGDYLEGWKEYGWRWQQEKHARFKRDFSQPQWDGGPLMGKTIFLHSEQGDGDSIQFIRYVSLVAERGGRIVVECPVSLRALFSSVAGIDMLISQGEEVGDFDVHAPLLSLPHILETTLETIPGGVPYVAADACLADHLRIDAERRAGARAVGIVWAGSPAHENDRQRSTQLACFLELAALPDITLVSLQVGDRRSDLRDVDPAGETILDLGKRLQSYADTAAVIDQLDLVITVDTAVAHLAGAMGKPVWVLLPYAPDFRWMLGRNDSPWYPTATLFRQNRQDKVGDWGSVFAEVISVLSSLCTIPKPS